jgi:serine/threonine-protein kinase
VVYAQSNNGRLYALHASTGREKQWSFLTNNNASTASPAVSEGLVYIASYRQNPNGELVGGSTLYAVDASTGHRKWTFAADGRMAGDPTVSQGTVYIGGYRAQCSKKIGTRSNCDSSLP